MSTYSFSLQILVHFIFHKLGESALTSSNLLQYHRINYTVITIIAGAFYKAIYSIEFKFVLDAFLKLPMPSVFIFFRR